MNISQFNPFVIFVELDEPRNGFHSNLVDSFKLLEVEIESFVEVSS